MKHGYCYRTSSYIGTLKTSCLFQSFSNRNMITKCMEAPLNIIFMTFNVWGKYRYVKINVTLYMYIYTYQNFKLLKILAKNSFFFAADALLLVLQANPINLQKKKLSIKCGLKHIYLYLHYIIYIHDEK